jgi:hypothetical protein
MFGGSEAEEKMQKGEQKEMKIGIGLGLIQ